MANERVIMLPFTKKKKKRVIMLCSNLCNANKNNYVMHEKTVK